MQWCFKLDRQRVKLEIIHFTEKQYTTDHNTKQYTTDHNTKQYTTDHNTKHI